MFDFGVVTSWFNDLLTGFLPGWAATVIECIVIGVLVLLVYALLALFYILYERKLCAWFQCRLGPMRV
ncbi:MAG TPA: NADH-quinone oxidoreductase subunit H, partial [Porphyromonadaceae bacterium]|nr:NADH-quinone oxidoreductase subunit H [Porphyromonadaceae bacterium]